MDISVVKIGNSKGIRLSKTILERYKIKDSVELVLESEYFIIKPKAKPRIGWEDAFQRMNDAGDAKALISDVFDDENFEEWS